MKTPADNLKYVRKLYSFPVFDYPNSVLLGLHPTREVQNLRATEYFLTFSVKIEQAELLRRPEILRTTFRQ